MTVNPKIVLFPEREGALWAAAARRQLERWEPLVAKNLLQSRRDGSTDRENRLRIAMSMLENWQGETERHFLLIATAQLVKALKMLDQPPAIDPTVADEVREVRDLTEHWQGNQPVFNFVEARAGGPPRRVQEPKYQSGKDFAERNSRAGPYCWWAWNGRDGPLVTPNVPATAVHELIETAIAAVATTHPQLVADIPPPTDRPWHIPPTPGGLGWTPKLEVLP